MSDNSIGGYFDNNGNFHPTPTGPKAIAEAIRVTASVTSIDVGYNAIGQFASLELLAAMMKGKSMASIGMAGCELGVEVSEVVAEMISVMTSLTYLWYKLRTQTQSPKPSWVWR